MKMKETQEIHMPSIESYGKSFKYADGKIVYLIIYRMHNQWRHLNAPSHIYSPAGK